MCLCCDNKVILKIKTLLQKYSNVLNGDFILTDILGLYFAGYFAAGKLGNTGIVVNL